MFPRLLEEVLQLANEGEIAEAAMLEVVILVQVTLQEETWQIVNVFEFVLKEFEIGYIERVLAGQTHVRRDEQTRRSLMHIYNIDYSHTSLLALFPLLPVIGTLPVSFLQTSVPRLKTKEQGQI